MSDGQVAPARGKEKFGHSLLDVSQFGGAWKTDRTLQDWLVIGKVTNTRTKVKQRPHSQERAFNPNILEIWGPSTPMGHVRLTRDFPDQRRRAHCMPGGQRGRIRGHQLPWRRGC